MHADQLERIAAVLRDTGAEAVVVRPQEDGSTRIELVRDSYMTLDQVSALLQVEHKTVRAMVRDGLLSYARTRGDRGEFRFATQQLRRDLSRLTTAASFVSNLSAGRRSRRGTNA